MNSLTIIDMYVYLQERGAERRCRGRGEQTGQMRGGGFWKVSSLTIMNTYVYLQERGEGGRGPGGESEQVMCMEPQVAGELVDHQRHIRVPKGERGREMGEEGRAAWGQVLESESIDHYEHLMLPFPNTESKDLPQVVKVGVPDPPCWDLVQRDEEADEEEQRAAERGHGAVGKVDGGAQRRKGEGDGNAGELRL